MQSNENSPDGVGTEQSSPADSRPQYVNPFAISQVARDSAAEEHQAPRAKARLSLPKIVREKPLLVGCAIVGVLGGFVITAVLISVITGVFIYANRDVANVDDMSKSATDDAEAQSPVTVPNQTPADNPRPVVTEQNPSANSLPQAKADPGPNQPPNIPAAAKDNTSNSNEIVPETPKVATEVKPQEAIPVLSESDKTIANLTEQIDRSPQSLDLLLDRGLVFERNGKKVRADVDYAAFLGGSREPEAFALRAKAWEAKKEFDKAIADYDTAIARQGPGPQKVSWGFSRALCFYYKQDFTRAIEAFTPLLEKSGDKKQHHEHYYNRGLCRAIIKDFDSALQDYAVAISATIDTNDENPDYWNFNGDALWFKADLGRSKNTLHKEEYYGLLNDAAASFSRAIALRSSSTQYLLRRALCLTKLNEWERALKDSAAAVEVAKPFTAEQCSAYCFYGLCLQELQRPSEALDRFKWAIEAFPTDPLPYNAIAGLHASYPDAKYRDGKTALEAAQKACELTAWKEPMYFDTLAAAYAETRDFVQAVKWQEKFLMSSLPDVRLLHEGSHRLFLYQNSRPYRDPPGDQISDSLELTDAERQIAEKRCGEALELVKRGEHQKAIDIYTEIVAATPTYLGARQYRAACLRNREKWQEAFTDYINELKLMPLDPFSHEGLASCYKHQGDTKKATEHYQKAFIYYVDIDNYESALDAVNSLIDLEPKEAAHVANRALCYVGLKNLTKALADYHEAIRRRPTEARWYYDTAKCYFQLDEFSTAQKGCTKAIEKGFIGAEAYVTRGLCSQMLGDRTAALKDFDTAIELYPANADSYCARAMLRAVASERLIRNSDQALQDAKRACELSDSNVKSLICLAKALAEKGSFESAVENQTKAIEKIKAQGSKQKNDLLNDLIAERDAYRQKKKSVDK